jgi:hypothetical protein
VSTEPVTLNQFIEALLFYAAREIRWVTAEATDEQLHERLTPSANSIAWLIWHLSRWRDHMSAKIMGEPEVWIRDGWTDRFDLPPTATGLGDSYDRVAAFRPERALLFEYFEAAHAAATDRISRMTPDDLMKPVEYVPNDLRPAWRCLIAMCGDSIQHTGQINFLRGLESDAGWRVRLGLM